MRIAAAVLCLALCGCASAPPPPEECERLVQQALEGDPLGNAAAQAMNPLHAPLKALIGVPISRFVVYLVDGCPLSPETEPTRE